MGDDYCLPHGRVLRQCCFDLPQLDTDATEFHLVVKTAQVLEIAIRLDSAPRSPVL